MSTKPHSVSQTERSANAYEIKQVNRADPRHFVIEAEEGKTTETKRNTKASGQKEVTSVNRQHLPISKPSAAKKSSSGAAAIKISLGVNKKDQVLGPEPAPKTAAKSQLTAIAFGEDSSSEDEEIPEEARIRMRNVGKFTKTSAGPNSYFKTQLGFCNRKFMADKEMRELLEGEEEDKTH